MNPLYIPSVTGKHKEHNKNCYALCSPSQKNPEIIRGSQLTILDCHTFYLRRHVPHMEAFTHYLWYLRYLNSMTYDSTIIAVAPDFDWLPDHFKDALLMIWNAYAFKLPCLAVPGSMVFPCVQNIVGHALQAKQDGPVHPQWTHSFSKDYKPIQGETKLWTYDSVTPC